MRCRLVCLHCGMRFLIWGFSFLFFLCCVLMAIGVDIVDDMKLSVFTE